MWGWNRKTTQPGSRNFYFRKTIKHPDMLEGVGLHSGETMKIFFHPAEEGTGITFFRKTGTDRRKHLQVKLENVIDTSLAVTVGNKDYHVQTIEHLMYAIYVSGITDLLIEIQGGSEIPILDGSAKPFLDALQNMEFHEYPEEVEPIEISSPVMVTDGNRYLVAMPAENFKVSYHIDYPHPELKNMSLQVDFNHDTFHNRIASARTFGFLKDVEYLKKRGLAQGGSTENVLVFSPDGYVNEPRFKDEPLYHKVLDLVGDLALVGRPIHAHILGSRGGHALDVAFGKKLLAASPEKKHAFSRAG